MGLRLYGSYSNFDESATYLVEIMDNEWSGASDQIDFVHADDVTYNFEGDEREPFQWIIPTSVRLTLIIATNDHDQFVNDYVQSDEGRFWIKITRASTVDFIGILLIDDAYIDDTAIEAKKLFSISAIDGLSLLKDKPYIAAQNQNYINQTLSGKFRATSYYPNSIGGSEATDYNIFNEELEDYGDVFNYVNGEFTGVGKFDFEVYISIRGDIGSYLSVTGANTGFLSRHGNDGFWMQARLYKIRPDLSEVDLVDPIEMRFFFISPDGAGFQTSVRVTQSITVNDVELLDGEKIRVGLTWDQDHNGTAGSVPGPIVYFYPDHDVCYFQSIVKTATNIQNQNAAVISHIKQCFDHLPTRSLYGAATPFFDIYITYTETNQSGARAETYIGLPYNAWVKNYNATPPDVESCWTVLETICQLIGGQLIYRGGRYHIHPFDYATAVNSYDRDFNYITFESKTFSEYPMECIHRTTFGYISPARLVELEFKKLTTKNLLALAAPNYPTPVPGLLVPYDDIVLVDRPHRIRVVIRVGTALKPAALLALAADNKDFRHQFHMTIKAGTKYAKVTNINLNYHTAAVYDTPQWSDNISSIDIQGPLQKGKIAEHIIDVAFDLPAFEYTGTLEVRLEYSWTVVRVSNTQYSITVLPSLEWYAEQIRFSTVDAADDYKYYNDSICTGLSRDENSKKYQWVTPFSDLYDVPNDPGAVVVWDGSEWKKPVLWSGESLQMRNTRKLANRVTLSSKLLNGEYKVNNMRLGHVRKNATDYYLMIKGSYKTRMMILSGQWIPYRTTDNTNRMNAATYRKPGSGTADTVNNTLSNGGTSTGGPDSTNTNTPSNEPRYEYFITNITADEITIPNNLILPNPADYTESQMMRMFSGSLRSGGNYVYRTTPSRPEHFTVDHANNKILLFRPSTAGVEHFFMWYIIRE